MTKLSHPKSRRPYTVEDMVDKLHLKSQQVRRNAAEGKYAFAFKEGKRWLFDRQEADDYVLRCKEDYLKDEKEYFKVLQEIAVRRSKNPRRCDMFDWTKLDSAKRCRITCGGLGVIERQGIRGNRYYFWDSEMRKKGTQKIWPEVANREQAEKKFLKILDERFNKQNGFKLEDHDGNVGEFMITKFLNFNSKNKVYEWNIRKNLYPFFKDKQFSDLTFETYCDYLADRREKAMEERGTALKDNTLLNETAVLKRVLNVAVKFNYDVNPKKVVSSGDAGLESNEWERILEPEERSLLYSVANEFWTYLLDFALNTGLRLNNICGLKWKAVKRDAKGIVRIFVKGQDSKNRKQFRIKLSPVALKVLEKMQTVNGHQEYVFLRPEDGQPLADRWVQREFEKLTDKVGIEDLTFHDLRRTFGCTMVDLGVDLLTIQNAMAHKSIQSTMRYVRPSEDKTDEAFDKIGKFWANRSKNEVKSVFEAEPISPLSTLEQVS